ncbi:hypothetical protein BLA29_003616, partial [Euroglyphus maynei]
WTKDSPLWILLSKTPAPTSAEVSLDLFNNNNQDGRESVSPFLKSPVIRSESNNLMNTIYTGFPEGNVKRQLFTNNNGDASKCITPQTPLCHDVSVIRSTKSVSQTSTPVKQESDENLVPSPKSTMLLSTPVNKNQRNSQIALFFRKVYSLASHRLYDLFKRLQITSDEVKRKIWTCFENAIQAHTYLMCDHHLDQIIMCCIYAVARININGDRSITFANIIDEYRLQPQGSSIVYRNVLLLASKKPDSISEQSETNVSDSPEANKKFGSVIEFYNTIFVPNMTSSYIMQFSSDEKNPNVKLSPMPRNKFASSNIQSPLRCVPNYPVFVSPLRQSTYSSPSKNITYRFQNNLTTSKDLEQINNMMKSSTAAAHNNNPHLLTMPSNSLGNHNSHRDMKASIATAMISMSSLGGAKRNVSKRILQDDNENGDNVDGSSSKKVPRRINLKIREIFSERQIMSASSSANASTSVSGDESNDSIQFNNPSANGNLNILATKMGIGNNHPKPAFEIDNPAIESLPKHQPILQPVVAQIIQQQSNGDIGATSATIVHHQNVIVPVTTITSNLIRAD